MSPVNRDRFRIRDATVVLTDQAMRSVYCGQAIDGPTVDIVDESGVEALNMAAEPAEVLRLFRGLTRRFFLVCGSSNFHHLDIGFLTMLREELGGPVQLVLFDRHMDCQRFVEGTCLLHCGNWVSFACRQGLVSRAVLVGCRDYRWFPGYDRELFRTGQVVYHPHLGSPLPEGLLDPDAPVHVSVDTDILSVPSDWGVGDHSLKALVESPVWKQLSALHLVGASVQGHVTDRRLLRDLLRAAKRGSRVASAAPWYEQVCDAAYVVAAKTWASVSTRPLPLCEQQRIVGTVVEKLEECRR